MAPSPAELVLQFHRQFDLPVAATPQQPTAEITELRAQLIREEAAEVVAALGETDLAAIAQELADLVYVAYGTALSLGIDLDVVLAEVHRANMSKLDEHGQPVRRADGKILKGPSFSPPDVAAVLRGPQIAG